MPPPNWCIKIPLSCLSRPCFQQTTDKQVNKVTPELFKRFPDAKALAEAGLEEIEELIKTCGF